MLRLFSQREKRRLYIALTNRTEAHVDNWQGFNRFGRNSQLSVNASVLLSLHRNSCYEDMGLIERRTLCFFLNQEALPHVQCHIFSKTDTIVDSFAVGIP
jgi:hypothetical protein